MKLINIREILEQLPYLLAADIIIIIIIVLIVLSILKNILVLAVCADFNPFGLSDVVWSEHFTTFETTEIIALHSILYMIFGLIQVTDFVFSPLGNALTL